MATYEVCYNAFPHTLIVQTNIAKSLHITQPKVFSKQFDKHYYIFYFVCYHSYSNIIYIDLASLAKLRQIRDIRKFFSMKLLA